MSEIRLTRIFPNDGQNTDSLLAGDNWPLRCLNQRDMTVTTCQNSDYIYETSRYMVMLIITLFRHLMKQKSLPLEWKLEVEMTLKSERYLCV
jgi:hypothetical protein